MSDSESVTPSRPPSPLSALPNTARPYRFTWDPSSRRPGPESVSGTTEGRGGGDYFSAQPRLSVLNNSSTAALALGALPQEWSSTKHGFHAISTVLNNPHKRQAPPKAHSSLPPVVPADLPRVRRKDFDPYLGAIGPEWERFQHNSQLGREGVAQLGAGPSTLPDREDDDDDDPTSSHVVALPGPKSVPPLNTVPEVFFQQSFNLGDPRTFNAVTEQSLTESSDPAALAHSLPLLEKFSHYADTVEQHLILEISRRSTSFFAALTNLHDLRAESEHCLTRIASLRRLLTDLDENSAKRGLEAVRRQARAENLVKVVEGVKVVGGVVEMGRVARGLVGAGQWGEALGVIEEMEKMWDGRGDEEEETVVEPSEKLPTVTEEQEEMSPVTARQDRPFLPPSQPTRAKKPPPNVPLSSLKAFSSIPEHLRALTMEIAASLSSELVSVLLADLVERINRGRKGVSTNGVNGNVDVGGLDAGLRDRLRPLLQGLVRTRGVKEGMLSWREVVLGEVRGVVKARLPAIDADDEGGTASGDGQAQANGVEKDGKNMTTQNANTRAGLAAHLRGMRHPEFMLLLQDIYLGLLNCVEGLQAQGRVIVEILEREVNVKELGPPSSTTTTASSVSIPAVQDELADVLSSAAELANTQAAKVISLRVEEHAALELADFLVFFNESWGFVVRCEVLCRKMIVGLRGTVVSQAKVFLQAFHQARISRSAKLVEDEQWAPAEISPSLQHITDVIVDSAVRDAPELVIKSDADTIFSPLPSSSHTASATPQPPQPAPGKPDGAAGFGMAKAAGAKHLRIEERTYFAVSATAEVLVLLLDYLRLVVNLTMLTTDTMSRVIEFLKAFNSRTCQVVLGAGAMRSAGLKHITAKHLALASQSLSIMFELIPYVRETFRRHLSQKQAVMLVEFDKLKRDYQEHQNEIHSKLVAIMGERLNVHIKSLQAVDWNVPKPGGGVNDYIEILAKETVNLHKILSRYLSTQVVEYVMTQVFAAINHGLSEEYGRIELPHQEAKTRLLEDAKYLHQKLSALKNVGAPSGMLVTVISEKSLPRSQQPSSPPPVPTPTRSNTLSANQRLRGLLSGKSATFEKALPTPTRTSSLAASTSLSPTLLSRSTSPAPAATVNPNVNGESVVRDDSDRSTSTAITTSTSGASPPSQAQKASSGFKQVEDMLMSGSDSESARGPDGPTDASAKLPGSGTLPLPPPDLQHRSPSPPLPPPPPHDTPSPPAPEVAASAGSASVSTGSEPESQAKPDMGGGEAGTWTRGSAAPAPGAATAADTDLGSSAPVPSQSDSPPLPPTPAAAAAPDNNAQ